jgi:hypothetical protein
MEAAFIETGWTLIHNKSVVLEKSAREMAELHLLNLRTWSKNDFSVREFDTCEVECLERDLESIATGCEDAGIVYNSIRQIISKRE